MNAGVVTPLSSEALASARLELGLHPSGLLRKLGELAIDAMTTVQEGINTLTICMQIKARAVTETVINSVSSAREHIAQKGGKAAVHLGLTALALAGGGLSVLKETGTAYADSPAVYQIVDGPWYLHDPNGPPRITSTTIGFAQTGDAVTIACHETGDDVNGDAEWDLVHDQTNGLTALVADYGTTTPVHHGQEADQLTALGIPECGGTASTNEFPPAVSPGYNGQGAADWALNHAEDPQPYSKDDEDCTWFVSQTVIDGGGLRQDSQLNLYDRYGRPHIPGTNIGSGAPGTVNTWLADNLITYIEKTYPDSTWQELDFSQSNQPEARPGDVIAYDWDGDGTIDHLAMVVDDAPGTQYPEIAEWGNLKPGQHAADYQKTGWTWSAYYNNWIQEATNPDGSRAYPHPHAYLLHIVVLSY